MLSLGKTIQRLQRNVETPLGISENYYTQLPDAPEIGGMVQGKADVPQLSTQQSDAMLKAHIALTTGLHIPNPLGTHAISHHSVAFADDTDNHINSDSNDIYAIIRAIESCEHSAQVWSNIVDLCGGLIALHKCFWQLLAWHQHKGYMALIHDPELALTIRNSHGTPTILTYLPPTEPNVGLGFHLCPDGTQTPQFQALSAAIHVTCGRISSAFLSESEARQALTQRVIPKQQYVLHLTSFNQEKCDSLNSILRHTFLPILRLNRHFPSAVLYGPVSNGGMGFPAVQSLQLATQLEYLIKQLRWNHTVAIDTVRGDQLHFIPSRSISAY
jgi:hypothetical protein